MLIHRRTLNQYLSHVSTQTLSQINRNVPYFQILSYRFNSLSWVTSLIVLLWRNVVFILSHIYVTNCSLSPFHLFRHGNEWHIKVHIPPVMVTGLAFGVIQCPLRLHWGPGPHGFILSAVNEWAWVLADLNASLAKPLQNTLVLSTWC